MKLFLDNVIVLGLLGVVFQEVLNMSKATIIDIYKKSYILILFYFSILYN